MTTLPKPQRPNPWTLSAVTTETKKLPTRMLLHSIPKWGKTSFAAHAPSPIFLMSKGEDGLLTLIDNGQIDPVAHFPETFLSWMDFKKALQSLIQEEHNYKTVVVDTVNGMERLCHEHYCQSHYEGDWRKFSEWGKQGAVAAVGEWATMTQLLDQCRRKGMSIILLCHSAVKTFKNPGGPDYDRWEPTLHKDSWAHLDRWCDLILFGSHDTLVKGKETQKGKAHGGTLRTLHTERTAAYDAGNRLGLPGEIECGESSTESWENFVTALKGRNHV